MNILTISLFPDMFDGVLNTSMLRKAQDLKAVHFEHIDLRNFGLGPRKQVDDTPYGGGDGMVLRPEPIVAAIEQAKDKYHNAIVLLPTPRGELFDQATANQMAQESKDLIFVCPRYEGYDERITSYIDQQFRIGNYVLTGGELPAMTVIDAVVRLLPGVLGGETSAVNESFQKTDEYVEHPQYTRPEDFRGHTVPEVLLSGNHAQIENWRAKQSKTIEKSK